MGLQKNYFVQIFQRGISAISLVRELSGPQVDQDNNATWMTASWFVVESSGYLSGQFAKKPTRI